MESASRLTVLSTRNRHKVLEFREILGPLGLEVVTITEVLDSPPEVDEVGETFLDNAVLKAAAAWSMTGQPSLADDSGLCVDALNGAPGLFSARWAGGDDEDNNDKLLRELQDVPESNRGAHYMCAIAFVMSADDIEPEMVVEGLHRKHRYLPEGAVLVESEGRVYGRIGFERQGEGGFGYDPLFLVPELDATFAEVPGETKHAMSHRGVALRALEARLKSITGSSSVV